MTPVEAWHESLSIDCYLALDAVFGHAGPHPDAALLHLAKHFYDYDTSAVEADVRKELYGALMALKALESPLDEVERLFGPLGPEVKALVAHSALVDGRLRGLAYAPGTFRINVGDVSNADHITVDGEVYSPLGSLQGDAARQPTYAWIAIHPQDPAAPVYLGEGSGDPERVADSLPDLIQRMS